MRKFVYHHAQRVLHCGTPWSSASRPLHFRSRGNASTWCKQLGQSPCSGEPTRPQACVSSKTNCPVLQPFHLVKSGENDDVWSVRRRIAVARHSGKARRRECILPTLLCWFTKIPPLATYPASHTSTRTPSRHMRSAPCARMHLAVVGCLP